MDGVMPCDSAFFLQAIGASNLAKFVQGGIGAACILGMLYLMHVFTGGGTRGNIYVNPVANALYRGFIILGMSVYMGLVVTFGGGG